MRAFCFDIETCNALELKDFGSWLYARHPSTDIRCVSFCLVTDGARGPIETWWPGEPVPSTALDFAADSDAVAIAFNNAFDRQIWDQILTPRYGWPAVPLGRHRCAQAAALARALPGSLDGAAAALKISTRKTKEGTTAMKRLAGPRKQSKKERKAGVSLDFGAAPEELETLGEYNRADVLMTMELVERVELLSKVEQALWQLDQRINERGVGIDVNLLESALLLAHQAAGENRSQIGELTGGTVTTPNQRNRILGWLKDNNCPLPNLAKGTVADALLEPGLNGPARALLELRQEGGGAAANKLVTLRRWTSDAGEPRIRFAYRFHGASPGRFTSLGCQLHNLRKPELTNVRGAIEAVATGSLAEMRVRGFDRPLETIGHITRAMIVAPPGKRLFIADLSGIEARGAAYVVGARAELEQWRTFDRTGKPEDEPYYRIGISTFAQSPETARKAGKTGALAFQYQGGVGAYRRITGDNETVEESIASRRNAWRQDHPEYVGFWRLAVFQAVQAIRNPGQGSTAKAVTFRYDIKTGFLEMTLPSGRRLTYPQAEIVEDEQYGTVSFTFLDASGSRTGRMYHERRGSGVFGGLLLENITQALCRDIFVEAMPRLEAAGYPVVMHTHDEFVCEVPGGFGSLDEFLSVITKPPAWAPDLPIAAKGRISDRLIEIIEKDTENTAADNAIDNAAAGEQEDDGNGEDDEGEDKTADLEPAPAAPSEPQREPAHLCIHCHLDPPDGSERVSAHNGEYLHPGCVDPFLRARMAEEGAPWDSPNRSARAPPPPPPAEGRKGNGAPVEPYLEPPPQPHPRPFNGRGNGDYPHGEHAGPSAGPATREHIYRNAAGRLYMKVVCTAGHQFPTRHWSGGEWVSGWPDKVVPYRLPELLAAPADALVLVCEGEKDADTAARYGFIATTNPGGAGKWQAELTQYFQGKERVCIVEDNDKAGAGHTAVVLKALRGAVPAIGVIRFPELGLGGDLSEYFEKGGSKPYLLTRIEEALKAGTARPYVAVYASEVGFENVSWLWPDHLAHGALELLGGDPDLGKSQIHMSYAACVTRGTPWPDGFPGSRPQRVLLVTAEDNYANTVGPRAAAAGVDLTALIYFKGLVRNGKHEIFLLSSGLQELEQVLLDYDNIGLVLIDPITAYMSSPASGRFDSHRATDVRGVLSPLKDVAERHRIAISAITHPPKGAKASPLDSFIGSQAYIAAARIAHLCVPATEPGLAGAARNTGRVYFTQVKNNIGPKAQTLAYHLDTRLIGLDRFGEPMKPQPYVAWEGTVDMTSAEALAQARAIAKTKVNPVQEFLRDILASGPVLQKIVVERGAAKGISLPQLRRAKKAVGAVTFKRRGGNVISPWLWSMLENVPEGVETEDE